MHWGEAEPLDRRIETAAAEHPYAESATPSAGKHELVDRMSSVDEMFWSVHERAAQSFPLSLALARLTQPEFTVGGWCHRLRRGSGGP